MNQVIAIGILCMAGFLGFTEMAVAQIDPAISNVLHTKTKYEDVVKTIDSIYGNKELSKREYSQYKRWQRWFWFMGSHLEEDGRPANVSQKSWEDYHQLLSENQQGRGSVGGQRSNAGGWTSIGPYTVDEGVGRADRIAFHPTNPNIIYVATPAAGLFRTTDGGNSWHPLNGFLPNVGASGIVIDKDNPNTIYVLTGDGDSFLPNGGFVFRFGYIRASIGIIKSTDGGATWFKLADIVDTPTTFFGYKLIQLNDFHYRFFACTTNGLYRSNDYGATWVRDETIGNQSVFDIEDAGNGYIYATTANDVYVSTNWGNPFSLVNNSAYNISPPGSATRTSVAITPNAPNTVYALFGGGTPDALYRSDNNGVDFTRVNADAPTTQSYMAGLVVSPTDVNTVMIGEVIIERSMNGGVSFGVTGSGVHADVHDMQFNPLNNILYLVCDGGVYTSPDQGLNWFSSFNGLQTTQFYHMSGVEGNDNLILAGAQDNGLIESNDGGATYSLDWGGDGFDSKFFNGNNNFCYISVNESLGKLRRSPYNFIEKTPTGSSGFYPTIAIHPGSDSIIYAGYVNGVYRSDNDGVAWTNKGAKGSAGGRPAGGLVVTPNAPDRVYTADNDTIWRSDNRGDNWNIISTNPGFPALSTAVPITDMTSRSNNADEIWITLGGYSAGNKVFYTNDGGNNWFNFSGTLPNTPVHCIKYSSEGDAYIGTDIGVFFMDFSMNDWVPFSNGLPLVPVSDLFINESNATIKASTFGRGIWQSDLYSNCGPFLLLSGVTHGRNFYQSNGFIETQQIIPGSIGNELRLRSPTRITFEPGFKLHTGAYLHAVIGNCGQGVVSFTGIEETKAISKRDYQHQHLLRDTGN